MLSLARNTWGLAKHRIIPQLTLTTLVNSRFRKRTSTFPDPKAKYSPAHSRSSNAEKRRLDQERHTNNNNSTNSDDNMLGDDKKSGAKKRKLLSKLFRVLTLKGELS
ncbi:unnamed protein product [Bursaphelenchus okinawaensis]|uniref:Uncharacterized protein n=1 Tax=Bursaphelenchus okinawaensis TaxID=465554 RepID=A0A811LA56_9BILA|nr:unnamed protein product [Bursaphelenchus okinawaensis]CAG9119478.1 unnamed protein product [Bursaphelenchus okinawaensis]